MTGPTARPAVTVTFAGSGDAFGSGGRYQACIHLRAPGRAPVLLDCGATSLSALRACGLDPGSTGAVFVSHLRWQCEGTNANRAAVVRDRDSGSLCLP